MRALSFKTGIACLCGTEVKEKLQCEYSSKVWSGVGHRERCCGRRKGGNKQKARLNDSAEHYSGYIIIVVQAIATNLQQPKDKMDLRPVTLSSVTPRGLASSDPM